MKKLAICTLLIAMIAMAACTTPPSPPPTETAPTEVTPTTEPAATAAPSPTTPPPTPTAQQEEAAYPAPPAPEESEDYPAPEEPVTPEEEAYPEPGEDVGEAELPSRWTFDGVISEGEYSGQIILGPMAVFWGNDGNYLYLAAETQTEGWLGIGMDPENRMQGADFTIAAFDGEAKIWDAYGQEPVGATHPPDTELGGTMDIVAWAAVQDGPFFRFEALRPLDSGDAYDKPLTPGETYTVIAAVGTSDAFDATHAYRGQGEITLE